jgi:hypothetical protein
MFKFLLKLALLALGLYLLAQEVPKLMQGARDSTTVVYTVLGALLVFYTAGSVLKKVGKMRK